MQLTLAQLPYPYDALEPYISRATLGVHHDKHYRAYVEKVRMLAKQVRMADLPLEHIIQQTAGQENHRALFNNAAQAWNHAFYWRCLRPDGGGAPNGEIRCRIDVDLGGYKAFAARLAEAAGLFGSGWAWLVLDGGGLKVTQTANADTPLVHGQTPLLTIDLWEHAYYLDYQHRRADYVTAVIERLINWDFVNRNLIRRSAAGTPEPLVQARA